MDIKPLAQLPVLASNIDKTVRNAFSDVYNRINQIIKPHAATHKTGGSDALTAADIAITPAGNITSTDIQAAINELDGRIGTNPSFRNKIINGDFSVWQRGTSFAIAAGGYAYTSDRWIIFNYTNQPVTIQRSSFTIGQTEVPNTSGGFLRAHFSNTPTTGTLLIEQRIENVITLAGLSATYSSYLRGPEGTEAYPYVLQRFGTTGASASVETDFSTFTLSSQFKKNSESKTIPSIYGKTLTDNHNLTFTFSISPRTSGDYDIAQVQLEEGSVATPFEQRPYGVELALCQRYYETLYSMCLGYALSGAPMHNQLTYATPKRATPTVTYSTGYSGNATLNRIDVNINGLNVICYVTNTGGAEWDATIKSDAEL